LLQRTTMRSSSAGPVAVGSGTDRTRADNTVELYHLIQKTKAERVRCYDIPSSSDSDQRKNNNSRIGKNSNPSGSTEKRVDIRQRKDLVEARLRYKPLLSIEGGSGDKQTAQTLLRVELLSGRKHQIRAQLSHIGHPIVGDVKYGAPQAFKQRDIALHAYSLSIPYPVVSPVATDREGSVHTRTFTVPPPAIWSKRFGNDTMSTIEKLLSQDIRAHV
jgi:23S rRNA-/tRNA-specific pseudouridylate synthase